MASKAAFGVGDLMPKRQGRKSFSASTSLSGMLNIDIRSGSASDLSARLQNAVNRASQRIATDLKEALDAALRSNVWSAPSGTADIFESGELLASGSVIANESGLTISYDAPYAALVHFGGYIAPYGNTSTRVYLPPRPWVQSVLNGGGPVTQFDFRKYYDEEIALAFRR